MYQWLNEQIVLPCYKDEPTARVPLPLDNKHKVEVRFDGTIKIDNLN